MSTEDFPCRWCKHGEPIAYGQHFNGGMGRLFPFHRIEHGAMFAVCQDESMCVSVTAQHHWHNPGADGQQHCCHCKRTRDMPAPSHDCGPFV